MVDRPIPEPGRGQVRIKVEACGICHSDALLKEGHWPGLQYPRVPGHEIAGRVDATGADVTMWKPGQRVGVGWHGGHCFVCDACRRGDFMPCQAEKITAISFDGGYAEYMVVPAEAVAAMPDDLPAAEAAPLLCAGIAVFNSLRNSAAHAGDLVAVQGLGGWDIWGFSMRDRWDSALWPWGAVETSSCWPKSWGRMNMWTRVRALLPKRCKNLAGRG